MNKFPLFEDALNEGEWFHFAPYLGRTITDTFIDREGNEGKGVVNLCLQGGSVLRFFDGGQGEGHRYITGSGVNMGYFSGTRLINVTMIQQKVSNVTGGNEYGFVVKITPAVVGEMLMRFYYNQPTGVKGTLQVMVEAVIPDPDPFIWL